MIGGSNEVFHKGEAEPVLVDSCKNLLKGSRRELIAERMHLPRWFLVRVACL